MRNENKACLDYVETMSANRVSFIGAILVTIVPVSMALYIPTMPTLVDVFETTDKAAKLTISFYFAGFAVAQLICGTVSDGVGRKPVTIAFVFIFTAASLVALLAPDIETLIGARFFQGFGSAVGAVIARSIVRDLFTKQQSSRILNLMAILFATGPAVALLVGGYMLEALGWKSIFWGILIYGILVLGVIVIFMLETSRKNFDKLAPRYVFKNFRSLASDPHFLTCSMVIAGSTGALHTQTTALPFILINEMGFSPSAFGVGMLVQTGMFFFGSLVARQLMKRMTTNNLISLGIMFILLGSFSLVLLSTDTNLSFWAVMAPLGLNAAGVAFLVPAMTTKLLSPFPGIAGTASSFAGFLQMAVAFAASYCIATIENPLFGLQIVIPALGSIALLNWALLIFFVIRKREVTAT